MENDLAGISTSILFVAAIVQLAIGLALRAWARALFGRAGGRRRWIPRLPVIGLGLVACGLAGTIVGLVRAFGSLALVAPERKAAALAASITTALYSTALLAFPGFLLYLVTLVSCVVHTLRRAAKSSPAEEFVSDVP